VTASSSNQTLIPDASLVVAGTDSNRTLAVRPAADQHGAATLTVHVSDGTAITTTTFAVNVTPRNDLPTAVADGFSVSPGSLDAPLDVLGNDLDADLPNDALTITAVRSCCTHLHRGSRVPRLSAIRLQIRRWPLRPRR
jgi:hypothetical protein